MLYFIPAWYQKNSWSENEQIWYERRMHTEFDDTVKQVQLFHRSKTYPYTILLLSFTPNLRHFLHRQSVYHAPYWSCFDAIQGIRRRKARLLSFHNLNWPEGIEFVYSPFVLLAMLNGKKYAQVEFGEDGNLIQINLYEEGKIKRRNIYDDRGFVSGSIVYENEKPLYQDYLTETGAWKMRCFTDDGHVEINPGCPDYLLQMGKDEKVKKFSRHTYESMEQVLYEVFASYIEMTDKKDLFCAAMHERHVRILSEALSDKKLLLSFYMDRYHLAGHPEVLELLRNAAFIITDSQLNTQRIKRGTGDTVHRLMQIPPYDTRVDTGISQQLTVQKILTPVDDLDEEVFGKLIVQLARYLTQNKNAQVCLFTRQAEYDRKRKLLEKTRSYLKQAGFEEGWAYEKTAASAAENRLEGEDEVPVRFLAEQCIDELTVSKCMKEQRVLVDLRKVPELYLQVTAVSIGIPQIACRGTQFLIDKKNGLILQKIGELPGALDFYLNGLANWNDARVSAYEIGQYFTTSALLERWKEVIRRVE